MRPLYPSFLARTRSLISRGTDLRQERLRSAVLALKSRTSTQAGSVSLLGLKLSLPSPSNEPLAGTELGDSGVPWLFLLQVGLGLPLALWTYKCAMLVIFQRKIIYLPSIPWGSRSESLAENERTKATNLALSGLNWGQVQITSKVPSRWFRRPVKLQGIELSAAPPVGAKSDLKVVGRTATESRKVVIIYFQGNAGTPLLRLPLFRRLLQPSAREPSIDLTILTVAPRSYWLSTRTAPTEASVTADYESTLEYAFNQYPKDTNLILYGHSLGGSAALLLLLTQKNSTELRRKIDKIVLENPMPSIPFMVKALYPQKWLPYHYLGPFAFDTWNALGALERQSHQKLELPPSLWIRSEQDEIIPTGSQDGVQTMYDHWQGDKEWLSVPALHDTAFLDKKWQTKSLSFLAAESRK